MEKENYNPNITCYELIKKKLVTNYKHTTRIYLIEAQNDS